MTPATERNAEEPKDCRRTAAAHASAQYGRGREGRSLLIDKLCEQCGYNRKHASKLLGAKTGWGGHPAVRKGRPPKYNGQVEAVL